MPLGTFTCGCGVCVINTLLPNPNGPNEVHERMVEIMRTGTCKHCWAPINFVEVL